MWVAVVVGKTVVPLNHLYDAPALAVNTTEPPEQKVKGVVVESVTTGNGLTVIAIATEVDLQPPA